MRTLPLYTQFATRALSIIVPDTKKDPQKIKKTAGQLFFNMAGTSLINCVCMSVCVTERERVCVVILGCHTSLLYKEKNYPQLTACQQ